MPRHLVVGAGFAGSMAAYTLAKNGSDVVVLERKTRLEKPWWTTGAISREALAEVGILDKIPSSCVASDLRGFHLIFPGDVSWEFDYGVTVGHILYPGEFYEWLASMAEQEGARYRLGSEYRPGVESADYIIGADGFTSSVAKYHFPDEQVPEQDVHVGYEEHVELDSVDRSKFYLYFGWGVAPQGYAWVFPTKEGAKVGFGVPVSLCKRIDIRKILDRFLKLYPQYAGKPLSREGGLIPTCMPRRKMVNKNVLLVGDAARFVDPLTGAGIRNALLSGHRAAKSVLANRPDLYPEYMMPVRREMRYRFFLKRLFYRLNDEEMSGLAYCLKGVPPEEPRIIKVFKCFGKGLLHRPRVLSTLRHMVAEAHWLAYQL